MTEFTADQYTIILKAIKENKFLSGNYRIYKFKSKVEMDAVIDELYDLCYIDHKNPPVKPQNSNIQFYDKEYKITNQGLEYLKSMKQGFKHSLFDSL